MPFAVSRCSWLAPFFVIAGSFAGSVFGQTVSSLLPIRFEPNVGQAHPDVRFLARGSGYALLLTDSSVVIQLAPPPPSADERKRGRLPQNTDVIYARFQGANQNPRLQAEAPLTTVSNYFLGADPKRWKTGVPNYSKVRLAELYEGIDLVFYGANERDFEYDFVVSPGADPAQIHFRYDGVDEIRSTQDGLELVTKSGILQHRAPVLYQLAGGEKQPVQGRFTVSGQEVGFAVGPYDRSRPLVIDPILSFSRYLGGSSGEVATGVALDAQGNAYVAGTTFSPNFPATPGSFRTFLTGDFDLFVAKIRAQDNALEFATYLGGGDSEFSSGIAVDAAGNVLMTGSTISVDYPTTNGSYQTTTNDVCCEDGVVTKLNPTGTRLLWSTYLAGLDHDTPAAVGTDLLGNVFLAGESRSASFPRSTGVQSVNRGNGDAFVAKLDSNGVNLLAYTFLGTSGQDFVNALSLDTAGNVYVTGPSNGTGLQVTPGALQPASGGGIDGFVAKFAPNLALDYATYLGGRSDDAPFTIFVSPTGQAFVGGRTNSTNFPVSSGAFQATFQGGAGDGFLARLNPAGGALLYSSYLGGQSDERVYGLAMDANNDVFAAGWTESSNFPLSADAVQRTLGGPRDIFATKLTGSGSVLSFSTLLGGSAVDNAFGAALDPLSRMTIVGESLSPNFPTAPTGPGLNGSQDAIVVRLEIPASAGSAGPPTTASKVSGDLQSGSPNAVLPAPMIVQLRTANGTPVPDFQVAFSGTNATPNPAIVRTDAQGRASTTVTLGPTPGPASIVAAATGVPSVTFTATVLGPVVPVGPSVTSIQDGAAFLSNISPHSWVTIKGARLAPVTRTWAQQDFSGERLPTVLNGVGVSFGGVAAAVAYISPTQINVLAPTGMPAGPVRVDVTTPDGSTSTTVNVQDTAPAFFLFDPDNRRYVAAVSPDGSYIGRTGLFTANPSLTRPLASRGRAMIFGNAWGPTDPPPPNGFAFSEARRLLTPPRITIGGQPAIVEFAGLIGPGLYQFNIIAPDLPAGDHLLAGEINGARSPDGVYITMSGSPPPSITGLSPNAAQNGSTIDITISGQNLANVTGVEMTPSAGVTIALLSKSETEVFAQLQIGANAAAGQRTLLVRSSAQASNSLPFAITAAPPLTLTSLSPASGASGTTIENWRVSGQNLGAITSLQISPSTGIDIELLEITPTLVTARMRIDASAPTGTRTVIVRESDRASNTLTFRVTTPPPVPVLTGMNPSSAEVSEIIPGLELSGQSFLGGTIEFAPSQGIIFLGGTDASGNPFLQIANDAQPGVRQVTVVRDGARSNALPFTIRARTGNFTISNLRISRSGTSVTITVDFSDPSRSVSNGVTYQVLAPGVLITTFGPTGTVTGQASGTIVIRENLRSSTSTGAVKVNMTNSRGDRSNTLEGTI